MTHRDSPLPVGTPDFDGLWINDPMHHRYLRQDVTRQLDFFRPMLRKDGGFDVPDFKGAPLGDGPQEIHTTARMVHSYGLAKQFGYGDCDDIIDAGMDFLWNVHRDQINGGYFTSMHREGTPADDSKQAYGHVFVLLAAATAKDAGHGGADRLIADVTGILQEKFWEGANGRFADEFRADWAPFSSYRGLNSNMHAVEAHLAAFEASDDTAYLDRAGRILDFFFHDLPPRYGWRLPEHFSAVWDVDETYEGNPMFRPAGSTPGHSFELGRLALHHWDLCGRQDQTLVEKARRLIEQAIQDATLPEGGFAYTMENGRIGKADRYWWPVTEAIGAVAALQKVDPTAKDEALYRALWVLCDSRFIDHERGGWFPEIDEAGRPRAKQFQGKPDIYHSIQAGLFPPVPALSRLAKQ